MGTAITPAHRQTAYDYFDSAPHEREETVEFRRAHKFSTKTFKALKADWAGQRELEKLQTKGLVRANALIGSALPGETPIRDEMRDEFEDGKRVKRVPGFNDYLDRDGVFDIKVAINLHLKEIFDGLKNAAASGNAPAAKILLQVSGDLVEESKTKVTHDFDIKGAVQTAQKELADWKARGGMGKVHDEPPLLLDDVHVAPE